MGNHKFRLSDMMPNAWFYKLKDMGKTRNSYISSNPSMKKKQPPFPPESQLPSNVFQPQSRKSYYYTRGEPVKPKSPDNRFSVSPRKSTRKHRRPLPRSKISPKLVSSSVSSGCSYRDSTLEGDKIISPKSSSPELFSGSPPPLDEHLEFRADPFMPTESFDDLVSWSSSCSYKAINSEVKKLETFDGFDSISKPELTPIITKPREAVNNQIRKNESMQGSLSIKQLKEDDKKTSPAMTKEQRIHSPGRKFQLSTSQGVRLRVNSPRIGTKKVQVNGRKSLSSSSSSSSSRTSSQRSSLSDSLAIVKSSFDPLKDFKESMVEMIVQNDMKSSKDLEDLLVCYLSLNADEYHDLIIKVFKQIWFDFSNIKRK